METTNEKETSIRAPISQILKVANVDQLKRLVEVKQQMDDLEEQRTDLAKRLAEIDNAIQRLGKDEKILVVSHKDKSGETLSDVVENVLKNTDRPLHISEIADTILVEKRYKTRSKNLRGQLGVMLYRDHKNRFKKVGRGLFTIKGRAKSPTTKLRKASKSQPQASA